MSAGIYFHIPFCARKCPYCDFYSIGYTAQKASAFVSAAITQLSSLPKLAADTVYFGGGTPSLLDIREIERLLNAARERFEISEGSEITLEANPADLTAQKLRDYRSLGINRLSIGFQSLDDRFLKILGRRHDAKTARAALEMARQSGFSNISVDMMLALPHMTCDDAARAASDFAALPVEHISMYLLKLCEGTPFGRTPPPNVPCDDLAAEQYERAADILARGGFERYEISNFAKDNHYSKHNLKYWFCEDYAGVGPGAHSSLARLRTSVPRDLEGYIRDPLASIDEGEVTATDYIICTLRTSFGLDEMKLRGLFGFSFDADTQRELATLEKGGFLTREDDVIRLTARGMLVQNSVLARII